MSPDEPFMAHLGRLLSISPHTMADSDTSSSLKRVHDDHSIFRPRGQQSSKAEVPETLSQRTGREEVHTVAQLGVSQRFACRVLGCWLQAFEDDARSKQKKIAELSSRGKANDLVDVQLSDIYVWEIRLVFSTKGR
jgi:hypothetical protein